MTLIKSISGIRGTLGGKKGENLTPPDIVSFVAAYGHLAGRDSSSRTIVVGRDGRISGPEVEGLVINTLVMMGFEVLNLGISTTPTVEMAVTQQNAAGGIIITASHNPKHWNALKFLNSDGEFISQDHGRRLLTLAEEGSVEFAGIENYGTTRKLNRALEEHIDAIIRLPYVDAKAVADRQFTIGIDAINSSGALALPALLNRMGCKYFVINDEINGRFAHNPEPLATHLSQLMQSVVDAKADLGIAVDPDVDRLAFIDETGHYCGEEYTLVMVADWVLRNNPGNTVSNLSSTQALRDITNEHGKDHFASAVGEVNVVQKMKEVGAVIGGEGNGGVILPELHYGRDALVGTAILLTALARDRCTLSAYRARFPEYMMAKDRIELNPAIDVDLLLERVYRQFASLETDLTDGVKIFMNDGWVHLRKSNTEPIIRIYAEDKSQKGLDEISRTIQSSISSILDSA